MLSGAIFAGDITRAATPAAIICVGPDQTHNLAKEITPIDSKSKCGQFVLHGPKESIDSRDVLINWFS